MHQFKYTLSISALILGSISYANADSLLLPSEDNNNHPAHVELSVKPGNKRTLKESEFFIPIIQGKDNIFFSSIRGMLDNKRQKEGNIGLGYRHVL